MHSRINKAVIPTLIYFTLAVFSHSFASSGNSWVKCIQDLPDNFDKALLETCHNEIKISNLKTITQSTTIPLVTHSYTLDLGLGEPVFGSLKRSRDKFIKKHITDNISKIEEFRDNNIRKFNLKSAYNNIVSPDDHDIVSRLKSLFGLDNLASTFAAIKASRQQKCDDKFDAKKDICDAITHHPTKSKCLSEAQAIKSNCFKFTTNKPLFNSITSLLDQYEKQLLDAVNSVSLVESDGFKSLKETLSSTTSLIDAKSSELNKVLSVGVDGKLGSYLQGNVTDLLERKIGNLIGVDETLLGPGTYANKKEEDDYFLNFNQDFSGSINTSGNLCNLTKCLMYPKSKRDSTDYKQTCVAAGLSEGDLNQTINHVRRKLTNFAGQLVLRTLMIDIPLQAQLKSLRSTLVCAQLATLNTIQGKVTNTIASAGGFTSSTISGTMTSITKSDATTPISDKADAKTFSQCMKEGAPQEASAEKTTGGASLGKSSTLIKNFLAFTAYFNIPYASAISAQVGVEVDSILTGIPKTVAALDYCTAKGKSEAWTENYTKCKADFDSFTAGVTVNASVGKLIAAQRSWTKAQCRSNLNFAPKVYKYTAQSAKSNPQLQPDPTSPNSERWDDLTSLLIEAKQVLHKAKIKPFSFPTTHSICANNLFEVIRKQNNNIYSNSDYECQVLDSPSAPFISPGLVIIDDLQLQPGAPTTALIPSIIELCESSATIVRDHPVLKITLDESLNALGTGITRDNIPTDSIFNPKNSIKNEDEYILTRSISNIKYCDSFFTEVIGLTFPIKIDNSSLSNQNILRGELLKNQKQLPYNEMTTLDKANLDYNHTLKMLDGLSSAEAFNLCVKRSKYRELLYKKRTPIDQAVLNWCRVYKVNRFDVYYNDAINSFNLPLSTEAGRKKIDEEIRIRDRRFKDGST